MSTMAGEGREQIVAALVALYPEAERTQWTRYYRGWTREALRRQTAQVRAAREAAKVSTPDAELVSSIIAACAKLRNMTAAQLESVHEDLLDADHALWSAIDEIEQADITTRNGE